MNHRYKKIKSKKEEKNEKEKALKKLIISNISSNAGDVESMVTNLVIGDVPKIKMKKKKMKRKSSIKTENLKEYATTVDKRGILVRTVGCIRMAIIKNLRKQKEPLTEMEMSWCYVH